MDNEFQIKVEAGAAYVVSLPIGNALDISERAKEILHLVHIIACEDTRVFKSLLNECSIKSSAKIFSYHDHNEESSSEELLKSLLRGQSLALVSDAGTPRINDPGYDLIQKCYDSNIKVYTVPGPSSLTAALSISPIGGNSHFFGGFLSNQSKTRREQLKANASKADKIVYFESPHRLLEHLQDALQELHDIKISIHRELTKKYEESEYDLLSKLIEKYKSTSPKGEFVLIYPLIRSHFTLEELKNEIQNQLKQNKKDTEIATELAVQSDLSRKEIYKLIQDLKK